MPLIQRRATIESSPQTTMVNSENTHTHEQQWGFKRPVSQTSIEVRAKVLNARTMRNHTHARDAFVDECCCHLGLVLAHITGAAEEVQDVITQQCGAIDNAEQTETGTGG